MTDVATDLARREIDGIAYSCAPLPATKALRLMTRLTKLVGETALIIAAKGRAALDDVPADVLQFTVRAIADRLEEDEVVTTIKLLLSTMRTAGVEDLSKTFDTHFQGRLMHLFGVVQYALEVNYRDFFDALRSQDIDEAEADVTAA